MNVLNKYIWLVNTIMRAGERGLTMEQIADRWNDNDEMSEDGVFSKRTFHRHRNDIANLFGIEIENYVSGGEYRYRIADDGGKEYFRQWLLDSIAVNRIVTDSRDVAQYISVEPTKDTALPTMLEALKECRMVSIDYKPYWSDKMLQYENLMPHALKMFERRWYMIARYDANKPYRFFALDRMSSFALQEQRFQRDPDFSLELMFDGAYGIIVEEGEVESIRLKVDAYQANYLRSLPLHSSQIELRRNKEYSIFSLRVRPTFDLRQRILSLGSTTEVLKPDTLRRDIEAELRRMLAKYETESN